MNKPVSSEHRFAFLDALRAIAALTVAMTHMLERLSPAFQAVRFTWLDPGTVGVTIFFLCSGFIIPRSLERQQALGNELKRFWLKRFFRIYPLYWVSVALTALAMLTGSIPAPHDFQSQPLNTVLANLTLVQTFLGYPHLAAIYWTLTFELVFYVVVSVLRAARVLTYTLPITLGIAFGAGMLEVVLPMLGRTIAPGLIGFLVIMFCGTLFYRWQSGNLPARVAGIAIVFGLTTISLSAIAVGIFAGNPFVLAYQVSAWVMGYACFGLVFMLHSYSIPRWLAYLGQISYSIYLAHPLVIAFVPQAPSGIIAVLIWLAVLIPVSALSYRLIEAPAIRLGERLV